MQYMLIFKETEPMSAERNHPEKAGSYWGAWSDYIAAMHAAGVVVSGNALQAPHTATTVRMREGRREIQHGPHPDTKEHLGGYFIVDTRDLDAAIDWAAKAPSAAGGSVEVRPVLPPMTPPTA